MTGLKIARGLELPLGAVTETFAVLAQRRVGKTYTGSVMAEEFAKAGVPFVVLDPTGAWWGLRSSADGERPGIPAVVLGGQHGDVPLEVGAGRLVADVVVDHPGFYVLDLESFESGKAQDTFVADFAERLYRRKARSRDPLHLFVDEADSFAPQRPFPGQQRMLGAIESIVRRGGIRGLGSTLITQRAAVLNKNVLTQASCLVVLRMSGVQDVAAIDDWVRLHGTKEQRDELVASLPSLGMGEAWVWSPGWLGAFRRVRIRERRTFNSSATPEFGETRVEPRRLAPVDLEALTAAMAETIEKAERDDPRRLRARIAQLEAELARRPEAEVRAEVRVVERLVEVADPRFETAAIKVAHALAMGRDFVEALEKVHEVIRAGPAKQAAWAVRDLARDFPAAVGAQMAREPRRSAPQAAVDVLHRLDADGTSVLGDGVSYGKLGKGETAILTALAQYPAGRSRSQVALLSGYSVRGGRFGNLLTALRGAGLIEGTDPLRATAAGRAAVPDAGPLPTGRALQDYWLGRLGQGQSAVLTALVNAYPLALTREEVAARAGYEVRGGRFGNLLTELRRRELIEGTAELRASEDLFG